MKKLNTQIQSGLKSGLTLEPDVADKFVDPAEQTVDLRTLSTNVVIDKLERNMKLRETRVLDKIKQ